MYVLMYVLGSEHIIKHLKTLENRSGENLVTWKILATLLKTFEIAMAVPTDIP